MYHPQIELHKQSAGSKGYISHRCLWHGPVPCISAQSWCRNARPVPQAPTPSSVQTPDGNLEEQKHLKKSITFSKVPEGLLTMATEVEYMCIDISNRKEIWDLNTHVSIFQTEKKFGCFLSDSSRKEREREVGTGKERQACGERKRKQRKARWYTCILSTSVSVCVCMCMCVCVCVRVRACVCVRASACMCACLYSFCIHIHVFTFMPITTACGVDYLQCCPAFLPYKYTCTRTDWLGVEWLQPCPRCYEHGWSAGSWRGKEKTHLFHLWFFCFLFWLQYTLRQIHK